MAELKLDILTEGLNKAVKGLNDLNKAVENVNQSQKEVNSTVSKTSSLFSSLKNPLSTISNVATSTFGVFKTGFNSIKSVFSSLFDTVFNLKNLVVVLAGSFIFKKAIDAAKEQEEAVNQLNIALSISGKYTEEASKSLQDYASSLQATTKYGDEVILQSTALIQSLGNLDEKGLKQATAAALDLSAALGIDLTAAATLVGKAAAGEIGSFSRYGVIIKKGADNAETFTNALTALQKKFGGAAVGQVNTYAGATAQLNNTWGDLLEIFGDLIVKNPLIIKAFKTLSSGLLTLSTIVLKNKSVMIDFVNKALSIVVIAIEKIVNGILEVGQSFTKLQSVITGFVNRREISKLQDEYDDLALRIVETTSKAEEKILISKANALKKKINILKEEAEADEKLYSDRIKLAVSFENTVSDISKNIRTDLDDGVSNAVLNASNHLKKANLNLPIIIDRDVFEKSIENATKNPFKILGDIFFPNLKNQLKDLEIPLTIELQKGLQLAAAGTAIVGSMQKGGKEFLKTLTKGAGEVLESVLGPIGPIFGEILSQIIDTFGVSADQFRQNIIKTFQELPGVIANTIINLADFIAGKFLDVVVAGFIERMPEIARALTYAIVTNMSSVAFWVNIAMAAAKAFIQSIPEIVQGFIDGIRDGIGGISDVFKNIGNYLSDAAKVISKVLSEGAKILWDGIVGAGKYLGDMIINGAKKFYELIIKGAGDFVLELIKKIPGVGGLASGAGGLASGAGGILGGITGAIGSVVGSIGDVFGFAKGGLINKVPSGYPSDSFPARLTSGELVVDRSTTSKLIDFLDSRPQQQETRTDNNDILLSRILDALQRPLSTSASIELNQRTFANILLELNRTNARVSA